MALPLWLSALRCSLLYLGPFVGSGVAPLLGRFSLVVQLIAAYLAVTTSVRLFRQQHRWRRAYLACTVVVLALTLHALSQLRPT